MTVKIRIESRCLVEGCGEIVSMPLWDRHIEDHQQRGDTPRPFTLRELLLLSPLRGSVAAEVFGLCPDCNHPLGPGGYRQLACAECGYAKTVEYRGIV